ncbi:MAG TPA: response regulator [Methylomirabilota bacterium]|jgi:CheY-like chemotaxis protein|nr:response regulator [Methylomirabilota bacterium]
MAASAKRILIVDDEREVAEALSEYLAVRGYAVETAADGPEALAAVRRARPDLVLLAKPFAYEQLGRVVRAAMSRPGGPPPS